MNIAEQITSLEANIQSFIAEKNIPLLTPQNNSPLSLEADNQCVLIPSNQTLIYLIAHEDVQIMENFLKLSQTTMNNIKKLRSFGCGMYDDINSFSHRLKIKIEPANSIEFSLIGSGLSGLRIDLKSNEISVSLVYGNKVSVMYSNDDDIDQKLNQALDLVKSAILNELGFTDCTEYSEEVVNFMSKSTNELTVEHFAKFGFDYIHKNQLIANICTELSISLEYFMVDNKNKETEANITIPYKMMSVFPEIMTSITSDISVNSKFKQIMGLVSFYDYLQSTETEADFMFKEYSKVDLAPSASMNSEYCFVFMSSVLMLTFGHQLKPNPNNPDYKIDATSENGYSYMFDFYIPDVRNSNVSYKYYCNDLDYIYNIMLDKIINLINSTILNTTETLNARHIEVFNMARF